MHKNHANKEESMIVYKKNKHTALFIPGKIKVLSHGFWEKYLKKKCSPYLPI